jgi:uncharacterized protein (TIGR00251 family)
MFQIILICRGKPSPDRASHRATACVVRSFSPQFEPSVAQRPSLPSCTLPIKAIPNAPRSAVVGWLGDALKVKVHAPALEGRVNDELCKFLADTLALPRRAVTVLQGDKSRQKVVHIAGLTLPEVRAKLGA